MAAFNNTTAIPSSKRVLNHQDVTMTVVLSILAFFCVVANSLVCHVIATRKTTDGALKYYVFSLALSDVLIGVIGIPMFLAMENLLHTGPHSGLIESISTGLDLFLCSLSIAHLCLMAFDRAVSVAKPIFHRTKMRHRKAALSLLLFPWLIALAFCIVPFIKKSKEFELAFSMMIISCLPIPTVFICVCYAIIFYNIRKRNKLADKNGATSFRIGEKRMVKTLLCVIIVFFICWIPLFTYHLVPEKHFKPLSKIQSNWLYYLAKFLSYFNSMCNPFIYAIFNPVFRKGFKDVFSRCFTRCKSEQNEAQSSRSTSKTATIQPRNVVGKVENAF